GAGDDSAPATRGRRRGAGDQRAVTVEVLFLLLFFFFFPFSPSPISLNRPSTIDFWRYRPVAGGPRIGKLTDRYVPPVPGSAARNLILGSKMIWAKSFVVIY
ncbi:hypothetical protein BHM03_00028187, partial [Ensete ventricosum]